MTPSTTDAQQQRLRELAADPDARLTYWCSSDDGTPTNGGDLDSVEPGDVHKIDDNDELAVCPDPERGEAGLHGTDNPHRWQGDRVWIVALIGEVMRGVYKMAARRREIVCEVQPNDCLDPQVGVRLGLKGLCSADLREADLWKAYLREANLREADLRKADLRKANLQESDLRQTNLHGADLQWANLLGADLRDANLHGTNLRWADLRDADLSGVDLLDANLHGTDLREANLPDDWRDQAIID